MSKEIRWYKGKYKVEVVYKWKPHGFKYPLICLVKALEPIPMFEDINDGRYWKRKDEEFPTVPRLLWRHPRGG